MQYYHVEPILNTKDFILHDEAKKFCDERNTDYVETSAKTGENIQEAMINISRKMINRGHKDINMQQKTECSMETETLTSLLLHEHDTQKGCCHCTFL